jgi:hypothetical protein
VTAKEGRRWADGGTQSKREGSEAAAESIIAATRIRFVIDRQ